MVGDIHLHQPSKVPLIENNDLIKQVSSTLTNSATPFCQGLRKPVAQSLDSIDDLFIEVTHAVENQMLRRRIAAKYSAQLSLAPHAARMVVVTPVQDSPLIMRKINY